MRLSSQLKMGLGAPLAAIGGLVMVLSPILGWDSLPRPWGFLLGFAAGLLAGMGAALAIGGLVERRGERQVGAVAARLRGLE